MGCGATAIVKSSTEAQSSICALFDLFTNIKALAVVLPGSSHNDEDCRQQQPKGGTTAVTDVKFCCLYGVRLVHLVCMVLSLLFESFTMGLSTDHC